MSFTYWGYLTKRGSGQGWSQAMNWAHYAYPPPDGMDEATHERNPIYAIPPWLFIIAFGGPDSNGNTHYEGYPPRFAFIDTHGNILATFTLTRYLEITYPLDTSPQWNDDANWIQPPPGTTGIRRLNTNPNEPDPRSQTLIFTVANQDSYSVNYSALPSAQQLTFPALTNAAWFQVRSADGKSLRPGAYIIRNLITGRQTAAQIRGCNTNRLQWTASPTDLLDLIPGGTFLPTHVTARIHHTKQLPNDGRKN